MAVQFTVKQFPISGTLKDECGLPFSCLVQPFAHTTGLLDTTPSAKLEDVGRCAECYAYINHSCGFQPRGWSCSLCGGWNEYNTLLNQRYARASYRATCPELKQGLVEVLCHVSDGSAQPDEDAAPMHEVAAQPVYVALVDVACGEEFLELVHSALQAALEALPPTALFGLATFSRQITLYDLQGTAPVALHVALTDGDADGDPSALELADALPLDAMLAPVAACKETIAAALEMLQPAPSLEGSGHAAASRGFGSALQAMLRYLGSASSAPAQQHVERQRSNGEASTSGWGAASLAYTGARLMTFLAGPPDYGRGAVLRKRAPKSAMLQYETPVYFDPSFPDVTAYTYSAPAPPAMSKDQATVESGFSLDTDAELANGAAGEEEVNPDAQAFYEEAAAAASLLGVCVDVYVASPRGVGLQLIAPLAASSGGAAYLYPVLDQAALPQDLYRRLSCPFALGGLLRLRTSSEYRACRAYGALFQDEQYDNLAHVITCDPHTTFAFDFEFANATGFSDINESFPMLQMVFQYSVLLPARQPVQQAAGDAAEPGRFVLQRRMRILTLAMPVAKTPQDVFDHVDADAVLCVLMHKIVKACEEEGVEEGRALLQDWLVILTAAFNRLMYRQAHRTPAQVDVAFEEVEAMQPLARLVYALLRSPLLADAYGAHPDARAAALHLWAGLPPDELRRAVYPILSSFTDPDTQAYPRHSLSRAALATAGAPLFLLDTFTALVLYYAPGYPAHIPFPPPQQSLLRRTINALRHARRLTPQLNMLRGGIDDVSVFMDALIEEPDSTGPKGSLAALGFVGFLEQIREAVWTYLQEES